MSLRFVRQLRNNTAQSLVLIVKLDARYGRRLAPPRYESAHTANKYALKECSLVSPLCKFADGGFVPSSKLHISCMGSLRISVRLDKAMPSAINNY